MKDASEAANELAALLRLEGKEHLRTGDKALCRFRFVRSPEMLQVGAKLISAAWSPVGDTWIVTG